MVFTTYRIYTGDYLTVAFYGIGLAISGLIYNALRKGRHLDKIVIPSILFSLLFGIFFWFRVGGVHGGGLIFFTFILIAIIVTPRKYSRFMVTLLIIIQLLLVLADAYLPDLNIWGDNPNAELVYVMAVFMNMSIVWMLKYNHDLKEERMAEFSHGLRELHRLNLAQKTNQSEVLSDYLKSGASLFNMEVGLIAQFDSGLPTLKYANSSDEQVQELLIVNQTIIRQIQEAGQTGFRLGNASNFKLKSNEGSGSGNFIGTPLVANNIDHGILFFCSNETRRKRFENYDIELIEIMAMNICQLLNTELWIKNQREADHALLLSDRRFKSIYDYANVGICVCDMEGKIVMANRALEQLLGFSEEELKEHTFYSISDSDELEELEEDLKLYEQIILGEIDHYILEKKKTTKHGNAIYISKTVSTIKDENNEVQFTVMIADDITVRKEDEAKINKLNRELEVQVDKMEVANKELEAFSYSVSHDLRAPLRAIDGFSKIILEEHKDEFSEESQRLLNVIINNSGKMATLIDDLLTFSRISRKVTEFKQVDLNNLVQNVIEEQALHKDWFEIHPLPKAKAEAILMKQVLSNLIGNAVKFSSKEQDPKIEIGCTEKEEGYEYYIKDNGVGFNMAYYDKIFGVFQRLHTDEEFKGTGVGLAIVQKVMMKHNGKVWAESEEGKGTIFYFYLPK